MNGMSRRRFLEDSMFAAAAAAAAGSSARLFAAEKEASGSPGNRLSVAVIGVRGRGSSHLSAYAKGKDTEVTYICDVDEGVAQSRASEVETRQGRRPKIVKDMREIFDDKSVDIVTTATPNHWHSLCGIWAMQAGKDVYVEKPVSHNVSEGRRMVEAARKYGRICQTGTQCRSNPGTIDAINFIKSGGIGEVKLARGLCYKSRGSIGPKGTYEVPAAVDFNLWSGPAPLAPITRKQFHYDWHWQWLYGNGDLGNQGIHQMDVARWGLGADGVGTGVVGYGGRFGYEDAGETANTQVSLHYFDGGKLLVFEVRGLNTGDLKGAKVGNIFHGADGYVVMTSYNSAVAFDPKGNEIKKFKGGDDSMHFANFIQAVRSRKHADLNADIEQGHLSSALCHLGNISYRLGEDLSGAEAKARLQSAEKHPDALETFERFQTHLADNQVDLEKTKLRFGARLAIDTAKETFTGESADRANPMLTREYRAPFVVPAAGQV